MLAQRVTQSSLLPTQFDSAWPSWVGTQSPLWGWVPFPPPPQVAGTWRSMDMAAGDVSLPDAESAVDS